jgi:hypothetical protein
MLKVGPCLYEEGLLANLLNGRKSRVDGHNRVFVEEHPIDWLHSMN